MQTLAKQEEFDDEDDWNPCKVQIYSLKSGRIWGASDLTFSYIMKYKIQHYANNCFILWLGRWCLLDATSNVLPGWYSSPRSTVRQGKHWTHRLEVPGRIINGVRGYSWRSRPNQFKTNRRTGNAYVNQTNVGFKRGSKGTIHLETQYVLWGRVNLLNILQS